jgi:hypothetical protein
MINEKGRYLSAISSVRRYVSASESGDNSSGEGDHPDLVAVGQNYK